MASKNPDPVSSPDELELFTPGDRKRTPWSAAVMNQILRVIRRSRVVRVGKGLGMKHSDTGTVIYLSDNPEEPNPLDPTQQGVTPLSGSSGGGDTYNCVCRYS